MNREQAEEWSNRFPVRLHDLWLAIRELAVRLEEAAPGDLATATHSFLYAIGNFKRQQPIFPSELKKPTIPVSWEAQPEIGIWKGLTLERDVPESWEDLDSIPGIAIPTATTVLAALWPSAHAILDRLTVQGATALRGAKGYWDGPVPADGARSSDPPLLDRANWFSWSTYGWYRERCILPTSEDIGVEPPKIERAVFELMRWQLRHDPSPGDESWEIYGQKLVRLLNTEPA